MNSTQLLIAACVMNLASAGSARVPVMAPPPPPVMLTDQQRSEREQACRSDVQRLFGSGVDRPAYLDAALRTAALEFHIRGIGDVLSSAVLELRVYVAAMVQIDHTSEGWIATQPGYFQCQFDHEGRVVAVEVI